MIAMHALIIFSEKVGFGHSITCNNFFSIVIIYFYIIFLCTWRVLQIFIENSYPAGGQLLCTTVNFQNTTQVLFDF